MPNLQFRNATSSEIKIIMDLASKALPTEFAGILTTDEIDMTLERMYSQEVLQNSVESGRHFIIVTVDSSDAGFGSFIKEGPELYFMSKLYVLPEYRAQGVGTALFTTICKEIWLHQGKSYCTIELLANHSSSAIAFYKKMGMKRVREMLFDLDSFEIAEEVYSLELKP